MNRLSSPAAALGSRYDVVVVGSGYGGAIAASRLARAGQKVCLLERGRELHPGEYPDTLALGIREMQLRTAHGQIGSPTGLFDVRAGEDVDVLLACGLGGGSLINAGVVLEPEPRVFQDPRWPLAIRQDPAILKPHFAAVAAMLRPEPYPQSDATPDKLQALERAATPEGPLHRTPIAVSFTEGPNAAGVFQASCTGCGDCCSGCNAGAKTTLLMTYLPDAVSSGAAVFTRIQVRYVKRTGTNWRLYFQRLEVGQAMFDPPDEFIEAGFVILAAGTLGSTEILLRSSEKGLRLSDRLGERFSGNGDALGFVYDSDQTVHGVGLGTHQSPPAPPPGPCITGLLDRRNRPVLDDGLVVQDAAIPGVLASVLPALFAADPSGEAIEGQLETLIGGAYRGPMDRTETLLVMGHDASAGRMHLRDDRVSIAWPGAANDPSYRRANVAMGEVGRAINGRYIADPLSGHLLGTLVGPRTITVHPLGGCAMADTAVTGVVDAEGRVFSGQDGTAVHDGLFVWDGSIVPRSLGVNPLLTISALADRAAGLLIDRLGSREAEKHDPPPQPVSGLMFTERMTGDLVSDATANSPEAFKDALQYDTKAGSVELTLSIVSNDLRAFLEDPAHEAAIHGTMKASLLSDKPLTVLDGQFRLFGQDPAEPKNRYITYDFTARAEDGAAYFVHGFKQMQAGDVLDMWRQTTTLFLTISRASGAKPVGVGILRIKAADFIRQLRTIEVTHATSDSERLHGLLRFGEFFAGSLFAIYGGLRIPPGPRQDNIIPRKKRPLRVGTPELYGPRTADGTKIMLTRYNGGKKGPVILAHAFGVNSISYSTDTVETNMLEYLFARGFDVWLFDNRCSPLLASAGSNFTIDDIARQDWPTAVERVRSVTGADSVQVLAHCVGSMSFLMACLNGMTGVRSAVCSQLTLHPVSWWVNRILAATSVAHRLNTIGLHAIDLNWHHSLLTDTIDKLLRADPVPQNERCHNPVCRRIFALFGPSYRHVQLSDATHAAIHEMFGVASASAFEHLSKIIHAGHVVDHRGSDVYMPFLDRLAFPILFIAGAENHEFYPETSERTFKVLCERNGDTYYRRQVFRGYAHMDCFVGKAASIDIFPSLANYLEEF